ncbi:MAG: peptidylprolyl isomerase [Acidobacteriota bacterium]
MNPKHKLWSQRAPDVFKVRLETSKGSFVIEAHREWAPRGVDRFYNLARAGFFDDSRFFRVRAGFIAQFGVPGDPAIAKAWKDETIPDDPARQSNTRGSIAYAMTGPNTRTTQLHFTVLVVLRYAELPRANARAVVESTATDFDAEASG